MKRGQAKKDDLRMPAAEFDRVMRQAFGAQSEQKAAAPKANESAPEHDIKARSEGRKVGQPLTTNRHARPGPVLSSA